MTPKPNIILINCDDLGYGDLGCYGSQLNATPHLDALARRGMRFTDFYVASPVCSASRAALLTGCYPQRVGFGRNQVLFPGMGVGLDPAETTIAAELKPAGYVTQIIGKWHCGDQPEFLPTRHGFDSWFGIPYSNDMGYQRDKPREKRCPLPLMRDETVIQEQPDQRGLTEQYTREALEFIRANRQNPFFLYLPHLYVHVPLFVPKPFTDKARNGPYGAAVECIDWSTGWIVDGLKQLGLLENTLLIFTSDNGACGFGKGGTNAPCRGTKGSTWEGGMRVPCIMHWPAGLEAGTTCQEIVRSIDLLPTLSRLAGLEGGPDRPIDGVDLSEALLGEAAEFPNDRLYYYQKHGLEAVRVGEWKLHLRKGRARDQIAPEIRELYHLRSDIGEARNRYDERPDIVRQLETVVEEARRELGDDYEGIEGAGCRPIGSVEDPKMLTHYREDYPYIVAEYDILDPETRSG